MLIDTVGTKKRTLDDAGIEASIPKAKKQKTEQPKRCYLKELRPSYAYMPICYNNCCIGCHFSCCRNCKCSSQALPLFGKYDDESNDTMSTDVFAQKTVDEQEEKEAADTLHAVIELNEDEEDKEESAEVLVRVKPIEIRLSADETVQIYENGSVDEIKPLQSATSENSNMMIPTASSSMSTKSVSLNQEQIAKKKDAQLMEEIAEEREQELNKVNEVDALPLQTEKADMQRKAAEAAYLSSPKIVENYAEKPQNDDDENDVDMIEFPLVNEEAEQITETTNGKNEDDAFQPIAITELNDAKDAQSSNDGGTFGRFEVTPIENEEKITKDGFIPLNQSDQGMQGQYVPIPFTSVAPNDVNKSDQNEKKEEVVQNGFLPLDQTDQSGEHRQHSAPSPFMPFNN